MSLRQGWIDGDPNRNGHLSLLLASSKERVHCTQGISGKVLTLVVNANGYDKAVKSFMRKILNEFQGINEVSSREAVKLKARRNVTMV